MRKSPFHLLWKGIFFDIFKAHLPSDLILAREIPFDPSVPGKNKGFYSRHGPMRTIPIGFSLIQEKELQLEIVPFTR
jgi:hypothetical protein